MALSDQDHIKFFESLMDKITDPTDQALIIHSAKRFFHLYGDVFRSLEQPHGLTKKSCARGGNRMSLLAGKTVLLTGATGGIGAEVARQLSGEGARLILTGRSVGKTTRTCKTNWQLKL